MLACHPTHFTFQMTSITIPMQDYVDLRRRLGVLEFQLKEALESRATLEKAAAHFMCKSYLTAGPQPTRPRLVEIARPTNQSTSTASIQDGEDLLALDDDGQDSSNLTKPGTTLVNDGSDTVNSSSFETPFKKTLNFSKEVLDVDEDVPRRKSQSSELDQPPKEPTLLPDINLERDKWQHDSWQQEESLGVRSRRDHEARQEGSSPEDPPDFFHWGIRFMPHSASYLKMRVLLSNLPADTSLKAVLEHIRGGTVVECVLLDTAALMGGTWSALIRFRDEGPAKAFASYCQAHPLKVGNCRVWAKLIDTASYPPSSDMRKPIYCWGNTRCLEARGISDPAIHNSMRWSLGKAGLTQRHVLEDIVEFPEDTLCFRFASIWHARRALLVLRRPTASFRYIDFGEDPCSQPLSKVLASPVDKLPQVEKPVENRKSSQDVLKIDNSLVDLVGPKDLSDLQSNALRSNPEELDMDQVLGELGMSRRAPPEGTYKQAPSGQILSSNPVGIAAGSKVGVGWGADGTTYMS